MPCTVFLFRISTLMPGLAFSKAGLVGLRQFLGEGGDDGDGAGLAVGGLAAPAAQGRHGGLQQVLRRQFDPADGQPQFTWLQGAGVGRIGIERPAQLPLRGTADQQAKPAVGSAQVRSGPRAAHRPDGDGGVHSRVTPGRCPTSWPSTYSAPSGAPASA
jgi:hypothetical protein